jgi:hypothetical protein
MKNNQIGNLQFLYAKLSANLIHFFNETSLEKHREIFLKNIVYKEHISSHLRNPKKHLKNIQPKEQILKLLEKTSIIYSFCIGEYRLIPALINQLGYDITILVEDRIKQQQQTFFNRLNNELNSSSSRKPILEIVSSNDEGLIYKLKKNINKGHKVLIFFDGNSGINKNSNNLIKTHFFSQNAFFHKGLAFLSHNLGIQPAGLILYSKSDQYYTEEIDQLNYLHLSLNNYCEKLTTEITNSLSKLIVKHGVSNWDTLESIHKWLDLTSMNFNNYEIGESKFLQDKNIEFNYFRYAPFHLGGEYYIFDKKRYLSYEISRSEYKDYSNHYLAKI